jgi:hypothetical protein
MNSIEAYIKEYSEAVSGRSPDQIRAAASAVVDSAISKMVIAKAEASAKVLARVALTGNTKKETVSSLPWTQVQNLKNALAAFAITKGNFREDRYWLHIDGDFYVSFPALSVQGSKGALEWALAKEIGNVLNKGEESSLIRFLASCGKAIKPRERKFLFAKGYTLAEDKESALQIRNDLNKIIAAMAKKQKGTFVFNESMEYFSF